jgi:hypothetical protein
VDENGCSVDAAKHGLLQLRRFLSPFTIDVLQAINNWQRGGNHQTKLKRGAALKGASQMLDGRLRTCTLPCYRQESHEHSRVWNLLLTNATNIVAAAFATR